jgi:hypothetical protein
MGQQGGNTPVTLSPFQQERLNGYIDIQGVAAEVDNAINQSTMIERLIGRAGTNVDRANRYILVRNSFLGDPGWIDLQHVVSAATNPFSPFGAGDIPGVGVEVWQGITGNDSAFRSEDFRSNALGANAAHSAAQGWCSTCGSIGDHVARQIRSLNPVSYSDAISLIQADPNIR